MEMITIPKGGRPPKKYSDAFLRAIGDEYKYMTTQELAEHHNVSPSTVTRWIRRARDRGLISFEHKSAKG